MEAEEKMVMEPVTMVMVSRNHNKYMVERFQRNIPRYVVSKSRLCFLLHHKAVRRLIMNTIMKERAMYLKRLHMNCE